MSWLRVDLCLNEPQLPWVEAALHELGAISIELSDAGDKPILEPEPGTTPLWNALRVSGLFAADVGVAQITQAIAQALAPADAPRLRFERIAERNWVREFKQSLTPVRFGAGLWVCPTGQDCPDPHAAVVFMDPGLAFGSGSHATTALCLDWLAGQAPTGLDVLDYGCGSGVLALSALALQADTATAIDIDPQALAATQANGAANAMQSRITIMPPDQLAPAAQFDLIVANILSNTLIELAPRLANHARPGTRIALSGILADQINPVTQAYQRWVKFSAPALRDGWALLHGTVS